MRVAVCTGIAGSQRREYLAEVAAYAKQFNKHLEIIDAFEVLKQVSREPVNEETVLHLPPETIQQLTSDTYRQISSILKKFRKERQGDEDFAVAVVARATFRVPGQILKVSREAVKRLKPDLYISIMHNLQDLKRNLDRDPFGRFPNITFSDILSWRREEIEETRKWGETCYIVARNEPPSTVFGLVFRPNAKKIYASFPISHSTQKDVIRAKRLIDRLRSKNYTVFSPLTIEDEEYVRKLLNQRQSGRGALAKYPQEELNALLTEIGAQTVLRDYALIEQSDGVVLRCAGQKYLRYAEDKGQVILDVHIPFSVGVVCEMVYAHNKGKRVSAVWLLKDVMPSPFFRYYCKVFQSEAELFKYLARARW